MLRSKNSFKEEFRDLGLGTKATDKNQRLVNQDGSYNIERRGLPKLRMDNVYHTLISMSSTRFLLIILGAYLVANLFFGAIYLVIGVDQLDGMSNSKGSNPLLEAFFFSAQTITTVGYGGIHPTGHAAAAVAALESLAGLLSFAVATGLLYGRFSRPRAKIMYSRRAVIAPYGEITGFMFRIANRRSNQLIEVEAQVVISRLEMVNGQKRRQYYNLELERSKINFFPSNWTIVHPITENSPIYGSSREQMIEEQTEIFILLKAFDDTFSQTVYSRSSYIGEEVIWGAKFVPMLGQNDNGIAYIDLSKLSDYDLVAVPEPVPQAAVTVS